MNVDKEAQALLSELVDMWSEAGVLTLLHQLIRDVWRTNVDRHEPTRLGDDALTLGVQSSRNICNLALRRLRDVPDVEARDRNTLEVEFDGRVLHTGKAPSNSAGWNVQAVDWTSSDVRADGAAGNSAAYQPLEGTLFEGTGPVQDQPIDPHGMRYLHLLWQGLPDGATRTWIGFPRAGLHPWFAVQLLDPSTGSADGSRPEEPVGPASPAFDALAEPQVAVTRRPSGQSRPASNR